MWGRGWERGGGAAYLIVCCCIYQQAELAKVRYHTSGLDAMTLLYVGLPHPHDAYNYVPQPDKKNLC